MAFKIGFILFALALTAVAAYDDYTDDELSMINGVVEQCLAGMPWVPRTGGGSFPISVANVCANQAWLALYRVSQQELTPVVVKCLQQFPAVSSRQVETARQCLVEGLAKDYHNLTPGYSMVQKGEIVNRVNTCLEPVPNPEARRMCSYEANMALRDGTWTQKEDLEDIAVSCLQKRQYSISDSVVATAAECLHKELAKDLIKGRNFYE